MQIISLFYGWLVMGLIVPILTSPFTVQCSLLCNSVAYQLLPNNKKISVLTLCISVDALHVQSLSHLCSTDSAGCSV